MRCSRGWVIGQVRSAGQLMSGSDMEGICSCHDCIPSTSFEWKEGYRNGHLGTDSMSVDMRQPPEIWISV